jgi:hypothetical protein
MPTPENPTTEHLDEFKVPENLNSEIKAVETNPKTTISVNSSGQPVISASATVNAKIQLPADRDSLIKKAKGSITDAATWLAKFFLRIIAKKEYANNDN